MDPSATTSITEFAIVVAGFTGLILALAKSDGAISATTKFRTVTMLFYAFSAAFGSLLPILFTSFNFSDIWRASSYVLSVILFANMAATILCSRIILSPEQRAELSGYMWALVLIGNSLFALWLIGILSGLIEGVIAGAFVSSLIWQLVLCSILFTRLLLSNRSTSGA